MRFRWPEGMPFQQLVLDVEQKCCDHCGCPLPVCGHRRHRFYTVQHPLEVCCRVAHCSKAACPSRPRTLSPTRELSLARPGWLIGWDVFCFIGHRRFARHWSVRQIRDELSDTYRIRLSEDAVSVYSQRYQCMVAARQQDPALLRLAYQHVGALWLSIDGLQPEKGHETLYAVRELRAGRIWFAEALLSSNADEVRRLLVRAREFAQRLGKPVRLWGSDKQDAFVKGIPLEFPGVPHRYCANHFLRDLARPTLERDSSAKVQMRTKVRGLRDIERDVLRRQANAQVNAEQGFAAGDGGAAAAGSRASGTAARRAGPVSKTAVSTPAKQTTPGGQDAAAVVLDYCCVVRGILNDAQGCPLHPPGLRMAAALGEVRQSLGRNLSLNNPGRAHRQLDKLARCIDRGLAAVREQQGRLEEEVKQISEVAGTLDNQTGTLRQRKGR